MVEFVAAARPDQAGSRMVSQRLYSGLMEVSCNGQDRVWRWCMVTELACHFCRCFLSRLATGALPSSCGDLLVQHCAAAITLWELLCRAASCRYGLQFC
jgi:hypothetical protein